MSDDDKKRGRGNPRKKLIGPQKPDPKRDRPDPSQPKCGASYRYRGIEKRCGKRGYHWKHGPG